MRAGVACDHKRVPADDDDVAHCLPPGPARAACQTLPPDRLPQQRRACVQQHHRACWQQHYPASPATKRQPCTQHHRRARLQQHYPASPCDNSAGFACNTHRRNRWQRHQPAASTRRARSVSPPQVDLGQVDQFVGAPIHHRLDHEQAEVAHIAEAGLRWQHQFLPRADHIDQSRPVMGEGLGKTGAQVLRPFDADALDAHRLGHRREVGVVQSRRRCRGSRRPSSPARRSPACRC